MRKKSARNTVVTLSLIAVALVFICVVLVVQTNKTREQGVVRHQEIVGEISTAAQQLEELEQTLESVSAAVAQQQKELEQAAAEVASAQQQLKQYTTKKS